MIGLMLDLLEQVDLEHAAHSSPEQLNALCRAMQVADEARGAGEGAFSADRRAEWRGRFLELEGRPLSPGPSDSGGPGSTTHVSVIDEEGNAASVTFSFGEGNGIIIEGTGIMMNNLMGEEDLFPDGFHSWPPGTRLATMMSPTLVVSPEGEVIVMGTGGANRIRSALVQVISNLVDHRFAAAPATEAPRVHYEDGVLNAEVFEPGPRMEAVRSLGARELVIFDEHNLFFGGVHLVRLRRDGTLEGAGDPRRGGACRVV
jgi:gamma-glutamyltranspeptidase/glutathione hydrolase